MSDRARSSPYNINTTSSRQVMRIKGNINLVIISCSNTNYLNLHYENSTTVSIRRISEEILVVEGLKVELVTKKKVNVKFCFTPPMIY